LVNNLFFLKIPLKQQLLCQQKAECFINVKAGGNKRNHCDLKGQSYYVRNWYNLEALEIQALTVMPELSSGRMSNPQDFHFGRQ
jgi:hypothetical protein